MLSEEIKKIQVTNDKFAPLLDKFDILLEEKPTNLKVLDATRKQLKAAFRVQDYREVKSKLIQTKLDEHSQNADEWNLMSDTHRKELQKEMQLIKQQKRNLEYLKYQELPTHEAECVVEMNLK